MDTLERRTLFLKLKNKLDNTLEMICSKLQEIAINPTMSSAARFEEPNINAILLLVNVYFYEYNNIDFIQINDLLIELLTIGETEEYSSIMKDDRCLVSAFFLLKATIRRINNRHVEMSTPKQSLNDTNKNKRKCPDGDNTEFGNTSCSKKSKLLDWDDSTKIEMCMNDNRSIIQNLGNVNNLVYALNKRLERIEQALIAPRDSAKESYTRPMYEGRDMRTPMFDFGGNRTPIIGNPRTPDSSNSSSYDD